jgi:hypothetical protein
MLHHIVFASVEAGAFFKIHAQGPVPQQTRGGDAIANGEGEAVGAKHIRNWLPASKLPASGPEHQLLTRGQLMANFKPDKRVDQPTTEIDGTADAHVCSTSGSSPVA